MNYKIIYLCYIPLNKQNEINFYMEDLIKAGANIEYWDLSKIFFHKIIFNIGIDKPYIIKIKDYIELEKRIREQDIKKCFFIIMIVLNGMTLKLYRLLTKYDCYLIYFARSGIPLFSINNSIIRKIYYNFRYNFTINKIKELYLNAATKFYKKWGFIKNYDLIFAAGSVEALCYKGISNVVAVNHFDYDQYLGLKDSLTRLINDEYCVFLDDNLIYDYDFKINNIKTIKPNIYFKSLCNLFNYIENKFNLKVIIAAHPKAEYQGIEFGNRLIIKNKTNELVKDCLFTIAHYSTSIAFSVLYEKPISFIYSEEMKKFYYYKLIIHIADLLGATVCNIDNININININDTIYIKEPDLLKFEKYKFSYLTSKESYCKLTKNIFLQYLCENEII